MGQRLVVLVKEKGVNVACGYYHWSGYSSSAAHVVRDFIEDYVCVRDEYKEDSLLLAIKAFTSSSESSSFPGLDEKGMEYVKEAYPEQDFPVATNRNVGIISITEKEIEDSLSWAEALVVVHMDTEEISWDASCIYPVDDAIELIMDMNGGTKKEAKNYCNSLPRYDIDIKSIPFDEFDDAHSIFTEDEVFMEDNGLVVFPIA